MKESHYNMYMKNVETLDTLWGTIVQQQASRQKRNLKVDLGKCVQMYRAPFLYLPGAPNSLNPPLHVSVFGHYIGSLELMMPQNGNKLFLKYCVLFGMW